MPRSAIIPDSTAQQVLLHLGRFDTRVTLLAATEGVTRFICAANSPAIASDRGIATALSLLAEQTGAQHDHLHGAIVSGTPLRLVVAGLPDDAMRTALGTAATLGAIEIVQHVPAPPTGGGMHTRWVMQIIEQVQVSDVLLLVIPNAVVPSWAAGLLDALRHLLQTVRVPCIVAGNDAALHHLLPAGTQTIAVVENVAEQLVDAIAQIAVQRLSVAVPAQSASMREQVLATALVAAQRVTGRTVLYLDLSDGCTVILAHSGQAHVVRDATIDVGAGAVALLARVGEERIVRWLPFALDTAQIRQWAVRRAAWPVSLPTAATDRAISGAFAREAVRTLIGQLGTLVEMSDLCILGPGMVRWSTPGHLLLTVADIAPFAGPVTVAIDPDDLLPAIGWLTRTRPESAAALFEQDALESLGTLLPVFGTGKEGDPAVRVTLDDSAPATLVAVPWGGVRRVGLGDKDDTLGTYSGADDTRYAQAVHGGRGGILVDARGRPLHAATDRAAQHERVRRWMSAAEPRGDG